VRENNATRYSSLINVHQGTLNGNDRTKENQSALSDATLAISSAALYGAGCDLFLCDLCPADLHYSLPDSCA
jgi:hypothetical protein